MEVVETGILGLIEFRPQVFGDERGWFVESFNQERYKEHLPERLVFVQDNLSFSNKGVLRGLHFQSPPYAQGKLVSVLQGKVLDVAVDLRTNSDTYGRVFSVVLDGQRKNQLFIPRGFAHGFSCLEDNTIFSYKCDNSYNKESERTLQWNDKNLAIDWKIAQPILSSKDEVGESFREFESPF